MKQLLIMILLIAAPLEAAAATIYTKAILSNQSTSRTSETVRLSMYSRKSVVFSGMSSVNNVPSNLSGTATLQCGVTATGPYVTAKDITGAAVTTATNTIFDIDSLCRYARVVWTRTSNKVSAWIFYSE